MAETPKDRTLIGQGTGEFLIPPGDHKATGETAVPPTDLLPLTAPEIASLDTGLEFDDPTPSSPIAEIQRGVLGATDIPDPGTQDPIRRLLTPAAEPIFAIDPGKITEDSAQKQMERIERCRSIGDHRTALRIGEEFYERSKNEQFQMPLYRFLSEISARMCTLLDPVRNVGEIDKWVDRLAKLLSELIKNKGDDFEIVYYIVALQTILDFFILCRCYLEKVKRPDEETSYKGKSFEDYQWNTFSTRLNDMIRTPHVAPKTASDLALRPRIDRLLLRLKNMVTRMRAIQKADIDRWDSTMLMRDRDSAVRTKLYSPVIKSAIAGNPREPGYPGAISLMTDHIDAFPEDEKRFSPLVLSARVNQIRYMVDSGEYHKATQDAERLFPALEFVGEQALIAQLHGIIGYGLFVLADLLLRNRGMGEVLIHISAEAKKFTDSVNLQDILTGIINRGEDHLRIGLRATSRGSVKTPPRGTTFRKEDFQKTATQLRSQLLFGYSLRLQAGLPISGETDDDSLIPAFQRAVYDLDKVENPEDLYFVYAPRLAVIIYHLRKLQPDIFDKEPMSNLLLRVKNICAHSLRFLNKERMVQFNPATFERVRQVAVTIVKRGEVRTVMQETVTEIELTANLDSPY
ncbi:MAG: hypothetical protein WC285_02530, partial [Candidatus Gracilibacteria bacterium]